jgi:hypothetical protein
MKKWFIKKNSIIRIFSQKKIQILNNFQKKNSNKNSNIVYPSQVPPPTGHPPPYARWYVWYKQEQLLKYFCIGAMT